MNIKKVTSQQRRGLTDGIKGLSKNNLERNNPLVIFDIFLFISSSSYAAGTDLHVSFGVKTKCRKGEEKSQHVQNFMQNEKKEIEIFRIIGV